MVSVVVKKNRKMCTLHGFMVMVLNDLTSSCTVLFSAETITNVELNCLIFLLFYCGDITERQEVNETRRIIFLLRECTRCLRTMEDIQ